MIRVLNFFLLASCMLVVHASPNGRVIGGENVMPGVIPHQASLTFFGSNFNFAGGALIGSRHVLTTASYLVGRASNSIGVIVGATFLSPVPFEYRSDRIVIHEDFDRTRMLNNIAIVRTELAIPLTVLVRPIALGDTVISAGEIAQVSGFGATNPDKGPDSQILQSKRVEIVECESNEYFDARSQHICASAAVCTSDIGGPLTLNNRLIGIALWHHPLVCGDEEGQDFYVRVTSFRNWIMSNQ